jgi:hypothetical protein
MTRRGAATRWRNAGRPTGASPSTAPDGALSHTDTLLRATIVSLTLATAYIHLTLGGPLFTLNAIGYVAGAAALIAPIPIAVRYRWLVRIGLASYAAVTITAWVIDPIFYSTAYLAKGIEVVLIALLAVDFARRDGNPIDRIRDEIRSRFTRPHGPASGRA